MIIDRTIPETTNYEISLSDNMKDFLEAMGLKYAITLILCMIILVLWGITFKDCLDCKHT